MPWTTLQSSNSPLYNRFMRTILDVRTSLDERFSVSAEQPPSLLLCACSLRQVRRQIKRREGREGRRVRHGRRHGSSLRHLSAPAGNRKALWRSSTCTAVGSGRQHCDLPDKVTPSRLLGTCPSPLSNRLTGVAKFPASCTMSRRHSVGPCKRHLTRDRPKLVALVGYSREVLALAAAGR